MRQTMMTEKIKQWKIEDRQLEALVKTLKKNMKFSDLLELDKRHNGILIKFWRTYYLSQANFCNWMTYMEKKEPKIIEKSSSMEEVDRLLKEIEEKYSDKH